MGFVLLRESFYRAEIIDFFDTFERNKAVHATLTFLAKQPGGIDAAEELFLIYGPTGTSPQGIYDSISNANSFIRSIHLNPNIMPAEKQQLLEGAFEDIIEYSKWGNKFFDMINEEKIKKIEEQVK